MSKPRYRVRIEREGRFRVSARNFAAGIILADLSRSGVCNQVGNWFLPNNLSHWYIDND